MSNHHTCSRCGNAVANKWVAAHQKECKGPPAATGTAAAAQPLQNQPSQQQQQQQQHQQQQQQQHHHHNQQLQSQQQHLVKLQSQLQQLQLQLQQEQQPSFQHELRERLQTQLQQLVKLQQEQQLQLQLQQQQLVNLQQQQLQLQQRQQQLQQLVKLQSELQQLLQQQQPSSSSPSYAVASTNRPLYKSFLQSIRVNDPQALRFSPNGKFLVAASSNADIHVFDVEKNFEVVKTLKGHACKSRPLPIAFCEDGSRLLISAPKDKMQVLDTSSWESVYGDIDMGGGRGGGWGVIVCAAAFRPTSSSSQKSEFATGDDSCRVKIVGDLREEKPKVLHARAHHISCRMPCWVLCLRFLVNSEGSTRLYSGGLDHKIIESDADNDYVMLRVVAQFKTSCINFSDIFPDGERIACATLNHDSFIVNLKTGEIETNKTGSYANDLCITNAKSPNHKVFVITASDDKKGNGKLYFTDSTGKSVSDSIDFPEIGFSCACSPNNRLVAAGHAGGEVVIFRQPLSVFIAESRMPVFKLRMLSKGKMAEACEIYNVCVLIGLYLA